LVPRASDELVELDLQGVSGQVHASVDLIWCPLAKLVSKQAVPGLLSLQLHEFVQLVHASQASDRGILDDNGTLRPLLAPSSRFKRKQASVFRISTRSAGY